MKKAIIASVLLSMASVSLYAETLKLGHVYDVNHPWHKSAEEAARQVLEKTEGRIEIDIYPSGSLGTEQELLEQVIVGGVDIVEVGSGQIANIFKPMVITEMPYMFEDNDQMMNFFESDTASTIFSDFYKQFNAHIAGSSTWGVRHVIGNKPITNPSDFEGFKLRVPEQTITVAYAKAMGSNPTPVPYSEAYLAMRQSMVDGLENPLSSIKSKKFYEAGNNLSLTGHVITAVHYLINDNSLSSLSEKDKKVVLDVFNQMGRYTEKLVNAADDEAIGFFKKQGVNIVEVDKAAFKNKTKSMSDDYKNHWAKYGDLYTEISKL